MTSATNRKYSVLFIFAVVATVLALFASALFSGTLFAASDVGEITIAEGLSSNGYPVYKGKVKVDTPNSDSTYTGFTYYYSDGYFAESPTTYNEHLASFSAVSTYACVNSNKQRAQQFFESTGATDFACYGTEQPNEENPVELFCAKKTLFAGTENESTLVYAIVRGAAPTTSCWISALEMGATGDAVGSAASGDKAFAYVQTYLADKDVNCNNIKIFTSSFSRGAAVSNLLAKKCSDEYGKESVYAYNFAPFASGYTDAQTAASYNNIHSIFNYSDIICTFYPSYMGFYSYGTRTYLGNTQDVTFTTDEQSMLSFLALNHEYNTEYLSPADFTWKRISISQTILNTILSDGQYLFDPAKSYGNDIREFFQLFEERILETLVPSRDDYTTTIPEDVSDAAQAIGAVPATFEQLMARLFMLNSTGGTILTNEMSSNLLNLVSADPQIMVDLIDYLDDWRITKRLVPTTTYPYVKVYEFEDFIANLWDDFENGCTNKLTGTTFKSMAECGYSPEQIARFKSELPTLVYILGGIISTDLNEDQQFLGTALANVSMIRQSHQIDILTAWAMSKDSFYNGSAVVENPYKASFDLSDITDPGTVIYLDGQPYTMTIEGTTGTVVCPTKDCRVATLYTYNTVSDNPHEVYPTHMYVWTLSRTSENLPYTATRQEAWDDLLQYEGSSIRIIGNRGIRLITSIPTDVRNDLIDGKDGFTLREYGTVTEFDEVLKVSGQEATLETVQYKGRAYIAGERDDVFYTLNGRTAYTNVLVNFTLDQCLDDLSQRPYMIVRDEAGTDYVIYGGTVHRSIGYIASQNVHAFLFGSSAYNYIHEIIDYTSGN